MHMDGFRWSSVGAVIVHSNCHLVDQVYLYGDGRFSLSLLVHTPGQIINLGDEILREVFSIIFAPL